MPMVHHRQSRARAAHAPEGAESDGAPTETSGDTAEGAGMRISVHLSSKVADLLLQGIVDKPGVRDILRAARELGVKLAPMYPKSRNPKLKGEFVVEVPDTETAERVVDRLNGLPATEA